MHPPQEIKYDRDWLKSTHALIPTAKKWLVMEDALITMLMCILAEFRECHSCRRAQHTTQISIGCMRQTSRTSIGHKDRVHTIQGRIQDLRQGVLVGYEKTKL